MNWTQLALLQILAEDDTARFYAVSSDDSSTPSLAGFLKVQRVDLDEMAQHGWIEITREGLPVLLNAGGVALIEERNKFAAAMKLLERASSHFENEEPDENWFKDYYLLTGTHAVLTDEGWERGSEKAALMKSGREILDEVNAPTTLD